MINYDNSMLPKLLAKENITVKHGNYKTAWFDVKDRTLGLPLWKDMGKDVYDLLIGHEVGHALETPYEGWHDSPEKLEGCPRSYINVIEDARIERKVQSRYPGLVGSFNRGYKKLFDQEFFGDLTDVDWDKVKLIDKINLKAKIGSLLDVPFTDEEVVYFNRAMTTETFEEVVDLVKDILAWTKENQEELIQKPEPINEDDIDDNEGEEEESDPTPSGHDDYDDDSEQEQNQEESKTPGDSGDSEEESQDEVLVKVASKKPEHNEDISITDEIYRSKEKSLIEQKDGKQPVYIDKLSKEMFEKSVISYEKLAADRMKIVESGSYYQELYASWDSGEFTKYINAVKKSVNFAVKEFEQRKAAYQYQKATTAKTGKINVNALWSYKTNDDIFLTATKLADAKSHGMMMLIDYSGSMSSSMQYVMDQVIHTVMFCKAVNIPFEVYGFTSTNPDLHWEVISNMPGHMDMDGLSMPQVISSSLKKSDFNEALKWLWHRTISSGYYDDSIKSKYEDWGSTPLNQALVVSDTLVKKFKQKHQVQKMNFITFTDGDSNTMSVMNDHRADFGVERWSSEVKVNVNGKVVDANNGRTSLTTFILKNFNKQGVKTIGFFMADGSDWKYRLRDIAWDNNVYWEDAKKEYTKEYRNNKCVHIQKHRGYDDYYMVKSGKSLSAQDDDFEVSDDASKGQIGAAFRKHAKSKKLNKVLMTKFGAAVA